MQYLMTALKNIRKIHSVVVDIVAIVMLAVTNPPFKNSSDLLVMLLYMYMHTAQ